MSPEEKPLSDPESDSDSSPVGDVFDALIRTGNSDVEPVQASLVSEIPIDSDIVQSEIVEAEISELTPIAYPYGKQPSTIGARGSSLNSTPAMAGNFENLAAKGGAVGALVLGVWCFAGSFVTNWSIINGLIGLLMGFWGLTSKNKKMAWIGIALCLAGMFLSFVQVSELVNTYLNARDENSF